jgi:hypothetical protein
MHKITDEFIYLTNFFWLETHRPTTKEEVFSRFPEGERPKFSFREKKFISLPAIPETEEIEEEK